MAGWGIAEWYGQDILEMSETERATAARHALSANELGIDAAPQPDCPFLSSISPGSSCNKPGGVCSMRKYIRSDPVVADEHQPTTLCPNRFLEHRADETLFHHIAREVFGSTSGAKVIKEIPFLEKETLTGESRGAKAGRIDWILVPDAVIQDASDFGWIAIETQAVYFSGGNMWSDVQSYADDPTRVHFPAGARRPDFRSSGAKRLAPQLSAKSPVVTRWGKKIAVVVDRAFFDEMGALQTTTDFDNAEIVWVVMKFGDTMSLGVQDILFAELQPSISALQAAKPVNKKEFENELKTALREQREGKVFDV